MTRAKVWMPAVDGLRGIAVLSVLMVHGCQVVQRLSSGSERQVFDRTYEVWSLGRTGVQLFFVLSGFLLFRPYAAAIWTDAPWPSLRRFWINRLRRVGPAYWVATVVLAIAVGATWWDAALHLLFLHNLTPTTFRSINDVFWSMAVEVQFYALLPVLALLVRRWRWFALAGLLGVSGATQVLVILLQRGGLDSEWLRGFLSLWLYLSVFTGGMLVAALRVSWPQYRSALLAIPGLLGLVGLMLYEVVVREKAGWFSLGWDSGLGLGFASLLWLTLVSAPIGRLLSSRALVGMGIISYSAYIWHVPLYGHLIVPVLRASDGRFATLTWLGLGLTLVLPCAWVSYRLLERPFHARPQEAVPLPALPKDTARRQIV